MKICAITDIHGRHNLNTMRKIIVDAGLLLIAGDITNFGDGKAAEAILEEIQQVNNNVLAIPGNCDQYGVNDILQSHGINLHRESKVIENIAFYGVGGCSTTPFNTPQEYKESEIDDILSRFEKKDAQYHILVSHTPPAETILDRTFLGQHVGSRAIRMFIEQFQPDLVICGHIHEARGTDKIGNTIIINPGPFPKHYATINIGEDIHYELH